MADCFQILSLDGGGIKGIFSAAVLAHLEDSLKINITNHFDLIVGTSTGGLIALGLGIGIKPVDILKFYISNGQKIFPKKVLSDYIWFFRHKYQSERLKECLIDRFGEKLLGESKKRLVIPSYNLGDDDVYLFKTPHHERLKTDYKVPIWQVAMATSAAPTYFPVFKEINSIRHIDGGIWANNPTMVGIVEAVSMLSIPIENIKVFSLGTTDEIKNRPGNLDSGGLFQWSRVATNLILRAQSIGIHTQSLHLLGVDKIVRLNPKVPDKLFKLDRMTSEELLSKAAHESRIFTPTFEEKFKEHKASEYEPIYTHAGIKEE